MCGIRSEIGTRTLIQFLRDLFRREPSQRQAAEVVSLPETAAARPTQTEQERRSDAA